jgi:hypothetical protein
MYIAISGKARSGKDTVAAYLSEKLGLPVIALAKPLYALSRSFDGITTELECFNLAYAFLADAAVKGIEIDNRLGVAGQIALRAMQNPSPYGGVKNRPRLIALGEYLRSLDPLFWVKLLKWSHPNGIIADVRQVPEMNACCNGGVSLRVNATREIREARARALGEGLPSIDEPTENALDDYKFDYVVENNTTLRDLKLQLDQMHSQHYRLLTQSAQG